MSKAAVEVITVEAVGVVASAEEGAEAVVLVVEEVAVTAAAVVVVTLDQTVVLDASIIDQWTYLAVAAVVDKCYDS